MHLANEPFFIYATLRNGMLLGKYMNNFPLKQFMHYDSAINIQKRTFEVQKQIKEVENGYIIKDNIENGFLNVIPLWQMGLTY
ncbi:MAG: hypothetical protein LBV72_05740 [Tannerella sp.]|jgi:hypothetical protein|nr:hypothetical protein [Tannerella sp.]